MLPASMTGLALATERYRSTARDDASTAESVFIPLSEALAWACSIDETLCKLYGAAYKDARTASPLGSYVEGLRFARNRCTHQLALVAERDELRLPLCLPATIGFLFRWRPLRELPEADRNHNNGAGAYENWLVGDTAENTLRHVTEWLGHALAQFSPTA